MPGPLPFTLSSTDFHEGSAIPARFTCDGADVSPELEWTGAPTGTLALALIVRDPDAHDFLHWLAFDIEGAPDGRLAAAVAPSADSPGQGMNDFGKRGYGGPCPPSGEHRYRFTLYALDHPLGIGGSPSLGDVEAAMKGHVLGQVTLEATYRRR
jgi:Raf kinase inhibitor-like YbhB/YbcL family protein